MAVRTMPDQQFLRECFDYEPWSGRVWWRRRPLDHFASAGAWKRWNTLYAGLTASSSAHAFGHHQICLLDQNWLAHRLIWKWMTGEDPEDIDHRDSRAPHDNRWINLRVGGRKAIGTNRRLSAVNRLGFKGVSLSNGCKNRYTAKIRVDGKLLYLGSFDSPEEGHAAYCRAAQLHFGEFWSPG